MNQERHQQISDLVADALEQAPGERAAFLDRACAGDAEIRREVESLLMSFDQAADFIESPAFAPREAAGDAMIGRRVGAWKITGEIGYGGMGTVYRAERADDAYREQAALKIVRRGMDTEFVLRRFRHERQILASLHHPNIARLLDGGTTDEGVPYFVMEYIEGRPIDQYCDDRRLSTAERVRLFRTVCAAVHHAHQSLVIHRDIKPANILITEDGIPKLLDFGIAKILNPEISQTVEQTRTMMRLMTPEYASPEQVRGEAITTASDVYSLGVVLYELLTGHKPYRLATILPSEIERVICEQEPARPSTAVMRVEEVLTADAPPRRITPEQVGRAREGGADRLRRTLAGDLDNIILMAMRKEIPRRYASVEHLSEDLRRHLDGLPVHARKDTLGYRADKFVRRNRVAVAAAALILLSLVAGLIATIWQARRARAQQARAERSFDSGRTLANFFLNEIDDRLLALQGSTTLRRDVVQQGLKYLDALSRETGQDAALQRELARGYIKMGDVQGHPAYANLGDPAGALSSYRKALSLLEACYRLNPADPLSRRYLANGHERIGDMLARAQDWPGARAAYAQTLALRQLMQAANPASQQALREVGVSYDRLGELSLKTGDLEAAVENYRRAHQVGLDLLAAKPADPDLQRDASIGYQNVGKSLARTGRLREALDSYRHALEISEGLSARYPENADYVRDTEIFLNKIGETLLQTQDPAGARSYFERAHRIAEAQVARDPANVEAHLDLAICQAHLGEAFAALGVWRQARQWYQRSLDGYLALRNRGALVGDDLAEPDRIGREIAKCEQAMR